MNKFVLDCENVSQIGDSILNIESQMTEMQSVVTSYDVSDNEGFNFVGAISTIAINIKSAAQKMRNTSKLFNQVIETHSTLQNSMKFEISTSSNETDTEVVHNVEKGDTLSSISRKYGTTVSAIASANAIKDVNLIHAGDSLKIPLSKSQDGNVIKDNESVQNVVNENDSNLKEQKVVEVPSGLGKVHTYMGWQLITDKSSPQYKLREAAGMNFDSEGFGKIGDRYVVATTTTFGNVGDYVDFERSDGSVLKCVIGDLKNQSDRNCNVWGHENGQNIVEFVVDKNSWYGSNHSNPGTASCHPEWSQNITKATNYGNYFDKV